MIFYLHADVSDGGDLSLHQQEVTNSQLVTESLVPGTEDSDVASECHFYKYFLFVCLFVFSSIECGTLYRGFFLVCVTPPHS